MKLLIGLAALLMSTQGKAHHHSASYLCKSQETTLEAQVKDLAVTLKKGKIKFDLNYDVSSLFYKSGPVQDPKGILGDWDQIRFTFPVGFNKGEMKETSFVVMYFKGEKLKEAEMTSEEFHCKKI